MNAPKKSRPPHDNAAQASVLRPVVLVVGVSGAGTSTALNALEDLGYEPFVLPLYAVLDIVQHPKTPPGPLAIRVEGGQLDSQAQIDLLDALYALPDCAVRMVFLDCEDHELRKRFNRTRRRHPLDDNPSLVNLFDRQRALLAPLRQRADIEIDTTDLLPKRLAQIMRGHFVVGSSPGLRIDVLSFSIPEGTPREAHGVTDMRFLTNPHYHDDLRPLTGQDKAVADYIRRDSDFNLFWSYETKRLNLMLERLRSEEGVYYYVLAYGCTGGRHRSVFMAEAIAAWLRQDMAVETVSVLHRELERKA